jgi:hypothetical protein
VNHRAYNNFVQATAVFAILFVLSQVPKCLTTIVRRF